MEEEPVSSKEIVLENQLEIKSEERFVYGLKGLQELLNCGRNTASKLANDNKYSNAGAITRYSPRKIIVDVEKFMSVRDTKKNK